MALYLYVKKRKLIKKRIIFLFSLLFLTLGLLLLSSAIYPLLSFYLVYGPKLGEIVSPVPQEIFQEVKSEVNFVLKKPNIDYTKASVWFPQAENLQIPSLTVSSYTLSIPKLGIEKALVRSDNDDLAKSLIHFTGPSPGEKGNAVIFGHSTLPLFYNPSDYKSIFTRLLDLKYDDEVFINFEKIRFRFKIFDMKVVSPDNLSVLEQQYDDAYLTLITCVPPGTYLKRLVVKGKIAAF